VNLKTVKKMSKMKNKTYDVPVSAVVNLKNGESKTTYLTLSEDGYNNYVKRVLRPFAESIYEQIVKDIAVNQLYPVK